MSQYCRACQQSFLLPPGELCPECGETMVDMTQDATLDMQTAEWTPSEPLAAASGDDPLLGRVVDHYQIERFLGRGGMARVYLARHLELERPCAIKLLRPGGQESDEERLHVFLHEARAAAALVHPHVVTIHTLGRMDDQRFIEMEYVDGHSLARYVADQAPLEPLEATQIMLQVSSALAAAHDLGIIHRDIKPGNVMLNKQRLAKLADFGLAKRVRTKRPTQVTSLLSGTPHYMAPELFRGSPAEKTSDVYSMGVTYFNLLTHELPLRAQSVTDLVRRHTSDEPLSWREKCEGLPPQVVEVLGRCLAKNPECRFAHASQLHQELRSVFGSLRSLSSLLNEALHDLPFACDARTGPFRVQLSLGDGRSQQVLVEIAKGPAPDQEVVRIYSVCGPTCAEYFEKALHLNACMPYGAIGIEEFKGRPFFVMANAFPRATCDPEEIRASVLAIGRHADEVERLLTGKDTH